MPHTPHTPPQRLLKKYTAADRPVSIAKYYAMCEWFDEICGELMAGLDQKGLSDNTLVIYVTDNGWIQDPKGSYFAPRSKLTAYEGGTRTPSCSAEPPHQPATGESDCTQHDFWRILRPQYRGPGSVPAQPLGHPRRLQTAAHLRRCRRLGIRPTGATQGPPATVVQPDHRPPKKINLASQKPELVKELGGLIHGWYPLKKRKVNALPVRP